MKTKYRCRLATDSDLQVCLSITGPRINKLCSKKEHHPLHWCCQFNSNETLFSAI